MKKGNLAVMLMLPFVVAFLGVTTVVGSLSRFDKDITDIDWAYDSSPAFKIGQRTKLEASRIYDESAGLAYGNNLVWSVANENEEEPVHAELAIVDNGPSRQKDYYLVGKSEGTVILRVQNEKNTVSKLTKVLIYDNFAFLVDPATPHSQANIDPNIYYGEFDMNGDGEKVAAKVSYPWKVLPASNNSVVTVESISPNASYDIDEGTISFLPMNREKEEVRIVLNCDLDGVSKTASISFVLVQDGVNVYDYDALLRCTNQSEGGEVVVLRKNFESLANYAVFDENGNPVKEEGQPKARKSQAALFGHYAGDRGKVGRWDFARDAYCHVAEAEKGADTTYIKQWNDFAAENPAYASSTLDNQVYAGLHVQKDFYGNGYTLNFHNLAYPYTTTEVSGDSGTDVVPALLPDNLFRGPLLSYCLGDPVHFRIIALYGEDNAGMYVDGDGVTINDLNVKNCDFGSHLSDLNYVGSVISVRADNVTICNSMLSNGKSVVSARSSQNLLIDNCILQNSYNFLLDVGSDEYLPVDGSGTYNLIPRRGGAATPAVLDEYLASAGDELLNGYIGREIGMMKRLAEMSTLGWTTLRQAVYAIGDAISRNADVKTAESHGSTTVRDALFYHSGVASIGSEAAFNGPFLYNQSPTLIKSMFRLMGSMQIDGTAIVPYLPTGLARNSYPVDIALEGETEFFDYKRMKDINLNGLIYQELSTVIARLLSSLPSESPIPGGMDLLGIDLDTVFPIKDIWNDLIASKRLAYKDEESGDEYFSMVSFYFGGGPNFTRMHRENWGGNGRKYREYESEFVEHFSDTSVAGDMNRYFRFMWKLVEGFIGFEPFKFGFMDGSGYNYGLAPSRDTLIAKAMEENA